MPFMSPLIMNDTQKATLDHDEASKRESSNVQSSGCDESSSSAAASQHAAISMSPQSASTASALIIAASDKAGMQGIDRAKIDAIILRESGNSAYMQQQRKRDEAVNQKIQQLQRKLQEQQTNDPHWKERIERELQGEMESLLLKRSLHSACVVVDLDMFYVNCELLTRPHLRNVPTVVGGGMILTSNYCARQYGVRSAMAGWIGDKLVEELSGGKQKLVHLPSNFELYREKSEVVRQVLSEYDPHLRAYSLDEAYLSLGPYVVKRLQHPSWTHEDIRTSLQPQMSEDANAEETISESQQDEGDDDDVQRGTGANQQQEDIDVFLSSFPPQHVLNTASEIVSNMRKQVHDATGGLTCSAGLAPNFMLAKIASDFNKPNGQKIVGPSHEAVLEFANPLPIRKIPGIGRVTEKQLHAFGISTVRDLYEQRALVRFLFQPATARFLLRASMGLSSTSSSSSSDLSSSAGQKGISRERTFASGRPWADIMTRLEDIARLLSSDMERKNIQAHTLTVKVKLHTFDVLSKSRTLARGVYLQKSEDMTPLASELLMELRKQHAANTKSNVFSVRLLGIRCSNFQGQDEKHATGSMNIERFLTKGGTSGVASVATTTSKRTIRSPTPTPPPLSSSLRSPPRSLSPATTTGGSRAIQTMFGTAKMAPQNNTKSKASASDSPIAAAAHDKDATTTSNDATTIIQPTTQQQLQQCPMCLQSIQPNNNLTTTNYNAIVNCHVDSCLNASIVRQAVREESATHYDNHNNHNKKPRLTDFFQQL